MSAAIKRPVIVAAMTSLLLAGCANHDTSNEALPSELVSKGMLTNNGWGEVRVFHDAKRGATCWYTTGGYGGTSPAISCLPDSQLKRDGKRP